MSTKIEVEVGDLYAELHEQFEEQIGEQYTANARQEMEGFIHKLNQQFERQMEQAEEQEQEIDDLDIEE